MIKILHTADWHLGQTFFGYDRSQEHTCFLNWLAEQIRAEQVDALIVAGDVFDVSNPSAAAQQMYYRFIHRVTAENPHLQLLIVAGNHDSAARLEAPMPLLETMRTQVRGVVRKTPEGEIDEEHLLVELKNAAGEPEVLCLAVPYLRQGDYPVVESEGNRYAEGVGELYRRLVARAVNRRERFQSIVAVGHLQATGSEIAEKDYSERTIIGGLECVSPVVFSDEVVYTALGHIHKAQRVSGREQVRYAGSPLPMSFAEKHYHHGVVVVTIDQGRLVEMRKLSSPLLVPLVSVPATGTLSREEILSVLQKLPVPEGEAPYLEVKVLLDGPDPKFPQEVLEVLADKAYRLTRIVPYYRQATKAEAEDASLYQEEGLRAMHPLQLVQSVFQRTYQMPMPEELLTLFQEACLSVDTAKEEDKA